MTREQWEQVQRLFKEALEREPEKRGAFLDKACGEDAQLRAEVESLVAHHEQASRDFLEPHEVGAEGIPPLIAHYRVEREIGRGGMGRVYLATDTNLRRKVAIKLLPPEFSHDPHRLARFEREARIVAQLNHPNVATIHELGDFDGGNFIAMEYIEGRSLAEILGPRPIAPTEFLDIAAQIAQGLVAAHDRHIVHRDLKPGNIMITDSGIVKLLDFGLAKDLRPDTSTATALIGWARLTGTGALMGTVDYMSPEQVRAQALDVRSDLFSFGALLYEMATGVTPFHRSTDADTINAILNDQPQPAAECRSDLPAEVSPIIDKLLEKAPEDRYQSAGEVLEDLRHARRALDAEKARLSHGETNRSKAIAVLPFADMSPAKDQEYFCDGLAEELINALTQVAGLRVVVRSSAFRFKGEAADARAIGKQLNVGAVLEGSVRKDANRIRVTAQLVDVAEGYYLWSQRYDRDLEDIFAVQDEIAQTIVDTLRIKLVGYADAPLVKHHTQNIEAYNLYLKGRYFWYKRHQGRLHEGIECFAQAIESDPSYALAHTGLSDSYSVLGLYGFLPPREAFEKATAAAVRALEIDPMLPEAHCSIGLVRLWFHVDREGSLRAFQRAIELSPSDAWAHCSCGAAFALLGRAEDAVAEARLAQELDPLSPVINVSAGLVLYWAHQYDEGLSDCQKAREIEPDHPAVFSVQGTIYMGMGKYAEAAGAFERGIELTGGTSFFHLGMLGAALGASDRVAEARQLLEEMVSRSDGEYVAPVFLAWVYLGLGDTSRAAEMYERAFEQGNIHYWNTTDPLFDQIRSEPRFQQFCERAGYPS